MIGASPRHLALIRAILREFLPGTEVRAFGSRVTGSSRDWSDIDLAIVGAERVDPGLLTRLQAAFEESDLPYRADLLDWHTITPKFRALIERRYEIIQPAGRPEISH